MVYRCCLHHGRSHAYTDSHSYAKTHAHADSASARKRDLRCV